MESWNQIVNQSWKELIGKKIKEKGTGRIFFIRSIEWKNKKKNRPDNLIRYSPSSGIPLLSIPEKSLTKYFDIIE